MDKSQSPFYFVYISLTIPKFRIKNQNKSVLAKPYTTLRNLFLLFKIWENILNKPEDLEHVNKLAEDHRLDTMCSYKEQPLSMKGSPVIYGVFSSVYFHSEDSVSSILQFLKLLYLN